ncbi:MAG: ABC transporter substrate-binding protein [Ekhidna sp.]|nr:ABC transporter substrate-binding protein [Ekhidna sp.]MBC6410970.1 ABC transporter substrate-binding protein [Ekhidna sp.]MBC6427326.1 ABC transporter substrate-binding protein [Ekhidna sp.]
MKIILFVLIVFIGCQPKSQESSFSDDRLAYASTFQIESNGKGIKLINTEPWPKATVTRAFTFDRPLKRIICTSTSHLPYFEMLEAEEVVVGFPNANFISSPNFISRVESGYIKDLGNSQSLNIELLIRLKPDAVIGFDAGGDSNSLDKVKKLGIPVIYNSDYLEQTPLGRAEYIKFFGVLLGKEKQADSIFSEIERNYQSLVEITQNIEARPSVLSGTTYGDTWFLPGGKNWAALFFKDAGGNYLWENSEATGWMELGFEAVYEKANDADYWIGVGTFQTLEELKGQEDRYAHFSPFKNRKVFSYNKKIGPNGGVDFFESAYSRPDVVLSDLIKVLHPELLPNYETVYFQRLP